MNIFLNVLNMIVIYMYVSYIQLTFDLALYHIYILLEYETTYAK